MVVDDISDEFGIGVVEKIKVMGTSRKGLRCHIMRGTLVLLWSWTRMIGARKQLELIGS